MNDYNVNDRKHKIGWFCWK